ncbi:Na(+)/H(+) antiporter subunit F [Anaerolineae bacterium CFX9]|mgnify:CR=1 FL=1|jgi:multicomponent Na+:H+ antiporter subunit F|nr:monovalent cation/H+ antiporter complex subunit F [Kamptonema cortianum]MDL1900044.1 Na(+)/H(+) antiporter subunit F [Anaerolineae bacterium CFX9]
MSSLTPLIEISLLILVLLLIACFYRVVLGPSPSDRLQAIETMNSLLTGVIVLLAIVQQTSILVDVAIALSAFSFIGTLAIARYIRERQVF